MSVSSDRNLDAVGLREGDRVRFRRGQGRWRQGRAARLERDGSLRIHDGKGAARAIPIDGVEVRSEGPRGGERWEPLADRIARQEQLGLW